MPEGDITIYNNCKEQLMLGTFNLGNGGDTLTLTLHTGYSPDIDTHQVWSDTGVSTTEYGSGSGYTAGGATLANQAVTQDNTNDRALLDADDVTWSSLGPLSPATPSHAILKSNTASSTLICYILLGTTATNGGNYTVQWSTSPSAIMTLT